MRYVCMHKVSPEDEAEVPPTPELLEGMGRLMEELERSGTMLAGEGLRPSATRFRLTRKGGGWTVAQGPYEGSNELPSGMAILKVDSAEAGLAWARRYGEAIGAEELEVGPLTEYWHLGIGEPPPPPVPLRLMILPKATRATESGASPTPAQRAALAELTVEMVKAGVLAFSETLAPSRGAVRARYRDNQRALIDGPFPESKELIGGFCMVQMRSIEEVLAFVDRFVRILGGTREIDVRTVADAAGPAAGVR